MRTSPLRRVLATALVLLPIAAHAGRVNTDLRALTRCRNAMTREALIYTDRFEGRVAVCLRPLGDCGTSGATDPSCRVAPLACGSLGADVASLAERLRGRVVDACTGVPLSRLLEGLGFAAEMKDCTVDSTDAFARCLVRRLAETASAELVRLEPSTCSLLAGAGLGGILPVATCAPGPSCPPPPPPPPPSDVPRYCGGPNALGCPGGSACDRSDPLCTRPDIGGLCVDVPATCADDGHPVCGCDGQTYASDCARLKAGVVSARTGACDPPPVSCGPGLADCAAGFFCDFPKGDCGEGGIGVCRPMRSMPCDLCTAFVTAPVCGCDYVTYASDCAREAAGMPKFFDGSCGG